MAALLKFTCMVLIAAAVAEAAIECDVVFENLNLCLPFATGTGPIGECCAGITNVLSLAPTKKDRRAVCSCIKPVIVYYPGVDPAKVAELPTQCGVSIWFIGITASTNCKKIK